MAYTANAVKGHTIDMNNVLFTINFQLRCSTKYHIDFVAVVYHCMEVICKLFLFKGHISNMNAVLPKHYDISQLLSKQFGSSM